MPPAPPPAIGASKLLKWADTAPPVIFTGLQKVFSGNVLVERAPRLAICEYVLDGKLHLYLCDEEWEVIALASEGNIDDLVEKAARWYQGLNWVNAQFSATEYDDFIVKNYSEGRCSFCRKWEWEYSIGFSQNGCNVCDACVREFFASLPDDE